MIAPPAPGSILVKERLSLRITLKNFLLNHSRNINTNTIFRILHTFIGYYMYWNYLHWKLLFNFCCCWKLKSQEYSIYLWYRHMSIFFHFGRLPLTWLSNATLGWHQKLRWPKMKTTSKIKTNSKMRRTTNIKAITKNSVLCPWIPVPTSNILSKSYINLTFSPSCSMWPIWD